jgi:hypothetical protein
LIVKRLSLFFPTFPPQILLIIIIYLLGGVGGKIHTHISSEVQFQIRLKKAQVCVPLILFSPLHLVGHVFTFMCQQTDSKDHHSRLNHLSPRCANGGKEYLFKNSPDPTFSNESKPIRVVLSPTPEYRRKADETRHRCSDGTKSPDPTFVIESKPVMNAVHADGTKSPDPTFSIESKPADIVPSPTPENREKAHETRHSDGTKIVPKNPVLCLRSGKLAYREGVVLDVCCGVWGNVWVRLSPPHHHHVPPIVASADVLNDSDSRVLSIQEKHLYGDVRSDGSIKIEKRRIHIEHDPKSLINPQLSVKSSKLKLQEYSNSKERMKRGIRSAPSNAKPNSTPVKMSMTE